MNLTLIYGTTAGESREEKIALQTASFTVGGLGSHNISLPGIESLELSGSVNSGSVTFQATAEVALDKTNCTDGVWQPSQRLEIGAHCLTLVSVDDNAVVIDVSLFAEADYLNQISPFQKKDKSFFGKRTVTYLLMLAVLCFGFLSPLAYHFYIKQGGDAKTWHGPTDAYWTSGDLVNAHQHREIDGNCQSCHSDLWIQAQDENCLQCHQDINGHADYNPHLNLGQDEPRCASCHKEHSGEENIINYNSAGCIDCHQEPHLWSKNDNDIRPITNFDATQHPEFKLNMLLISDDQWLESRVDYTDSAQEQSNLKFSHALHMDADKVHDNDVALECDSCHAANPDNAAHFIPVTMEANCMSCHTLGIDIEDDARQLPHGNPTAVVRALEEYLSYQYVNPKFRKNREQLHVRTRSVPGKPMIKTTFDVNPCEQLDKVFTCVKDEVEELARQQFELSGCITCHEVTSDTSKETHERWKILPVRLQNNWYAQHTFDHQAHLSGEADHANQYCLSCHAATTSESSHDVLVPGIQNCLQCHIQGDEKTVELDCLNCHQFHIDGKPQMSEVLVP